VFTYYLKDGAKTRKQQRQAAEKDADKKGELLRYRPETSSSRKTARSPDGGAHRD